MADRALKGWDGTRISIEIQWARPVVLGDEVIFVIGGGYRYCFEKCAFRVLAITAGFRASTSTPHIKDHRSHRHLSAYQMHGTGARDGSSSIAPFGGDGNRGGDSRLD